MKTCVVLNIIVKKILKHPNLTSQISPECTSKSGRICSFLLKKYRFFDVYLKTALDLNNINYLCLAPYSSKYVLSSIMIYFFIE
jgi:hypothetical protein